jgi:hypothetical protein
MRIRTLSTLALVALVWPADAQAGTISLDTFFQGYGAQFVVANQAPISFVIGSVVMSGGTGLGPGLNSPATFEAYCADFLTDIFGPTLPNPPGIYTANVALMSTWTDPSGLTANPNGGARAAWVYNTWATTVDPDATSDLGMRQRSALQMAIWNALYDIDTTVDNTLGQGGTTYFTEDNRNLTVLADAYLVGLLANPAANASWLQLSVGPTDAQDFIGPQTTPVAVPEPSPALLLGMGIMVFAAYRSRKSLLRRA